MLVFLFIFMFTYSLLSVFFYASLILSSRFFWVSSLAYSNLFGTKSYVVVVVAAAARNMGSWHWYCQTQIQIKVSVTIQVIFRNKCASIPRASSGEKGKRY